MAKKTTLDDIAELIEKGFASVASDISEIRRSQRERCPRPRPSELEAELKYGRYETRLGKLEDKVFGEAR